MSDYSQFEEQVFELAKRMRSEFRAFCATIDLLGIKEMMKEDPSEAHDRLNDLQQAFADALILFPGGADYRVCFAGDSLFVVKELSPEEKNDEFWPVFCGHIFALSSWVQKMERKIENPGLRVVTSYGRLFQLYEPESWRRYYISRYTSNWFVLTGASDALMKCTEAERQGSRKGFKGGYFWHELPNSEQVYLGTPFSSYQIPFEQYQQPNFYPTFYQKLVEKAEQTIELQFAKD